MPNFLGVGFFRCGTTWLHDLLASHPDCYVPGDFKEIHYFTPQHHHRGREWYEKFFPDGPTPYDAIGEIGPGYCDPECRAIIAAEPGLGERGKFLFMIRNHADVFYSGHRMRARAGLVPARFEDGFDWSEVEARPNWFSDIIAAWVEQFGRERVLVTTLESVMADPEQARERIAAFLDLDPTKFAEQAGTESRNASDVPRFVRAYRTASHANALLVRHGMHRLSGRLRSLGLKKMFGFGAGGATIPPLEPETRRRIAAFFEPDVVALEALLDIDLTAWRDRNGVTPLQANASQSQ